ncbi:MAG: transposase [Bacteroidetes bacterium]|nr:transposase [Bacteroidota bacterium]
MARLARVILPGYPHHITQRGNRRQDVFFKEDDYLLYLDLLKEWCKKERVDIWSYCLMTNHVHLVVTPGNESNLSKAIAEIHRRYTRAINFRENWRGFLWQGRFASFPMDESYLLKAAAYVELNPVKAKMVSSPEDYRWSSVHAHLKGEDPLGIVNVSQYADIFGDWDEYLKQAMFVEQTCFTKHSRTGRPLGDDNFIDKAEMILNRDLKKQKPGPKPS